MAKTKALAIPVEDCTGRQLPKGQFYILATFRGVRKGYKGIYMPPKLPKLDLTTN